MSYARLVQPEGQPGFLPVRFRTSELTASLGGVNANLPSITGSNPGTRAVVLGFHRHSAPRPMRVSGVRLAILTAPSPATIKIKAAIYAADEANGLPGSVLHAQLVSGEVAFSAAQSTAGGNYLDIPFSVPTAIAEARPIWIALMCESFYTVTDTTLGVMRGTSLRTAVSGPSGSQFDRDLTYAGAGVSTIASSFPSGIASSANFAAATDGTLANASCGLICVP